MESIHLCIFLLQIGYILTKPITIADNKAAQDDVTVAEKTHLEENVDTPKTHGNNQPHDAFEAFLLTGGLKSYYDEKSIENLKSSMGPIKDKRSTEDSRSAEYLRMNGEERIRRLTKRGHFYKQMLCSRTHKRRYCL